MDWQKGDLALCIKQGRWTFDGEGPRCGQIFAVLSVEIGPDGLLYLELDGWPPDERYMASRFRKVTPPEADAFDREVIEALNSEPVHARNNDAVHNSCQREGFACPDLGQVGSAG